MFGNGLRGKINKKNRQVINNTETFIQGVFRSGDFRPTPLPDYCFNAGYNGPLLPSAQPTNADLPCCPVCYPPGSNGTGIITSGVLSTTTTSLLPGGITTTSLVPGGNGGPSDTVTITATVTDPVTSTRTTLSIETITPTGAVGSPIITTAFNTIVGCGTARGCGTVGKCPFSLVHMVNPLANTFQTAPGQSTWPPLAFPPSHLAVQSPAALQP